MHGWTWGRGYMGASTLFPPPHSPAAPSTDSCCDTQLRPAFLLPPAGRFRCALAPHQLAQPHRPSQRNRRPCWHHHVPDKRPHPAADNIGRANGCVRGGGVSWLCQGSALPSWHILHAWHDARRHASQHHLPSRACFLSPCPPLPLQPPPAGCPPGPTPPPASAACWRSAAAAPLPPSPTQTPRCAAATASSHLPCWLLRWATRYGGDNAPAALPGPHHHAAREP